MSLERIRRFAVGTVCGFAAVMFHKAALSTESAAHRVVTPSQAFTRKISRLIVAVAIFTYRVIVHANTARNDGVWIVSAGAAM